MQKEVGSPHRFKYKREILSKNNYWNLAWEIELRWAKIIQIQYWKGKKEVQPLWWLLCRTYMNPTLVHNHHKLRFISKYGAVFLCAILLDDIKRPQKHRDTNASASNCCYCSKKLTGLYSLQFHTDLVVKMVTTSTVDHDPHRVGHTEHVSWLSPTWCLITSRHSLNYERHNCTQLWSSTNISNILTRARK